MLSARELAAALVAHLVILVWSPNTILTVSQGSQYSDFMYFFFNVYISFQNGFCFLTLPCYKACHFESHRLQTGKSICSAIVIVTFIQVHSHHCSCLSRKYSQAEKLLFFKYINIFIHLPNNIFCHFYS